VVAPSTIVAAALPCPTRLAPAYAFAVKVCDPTGTTTTPANVLVPASQASGWVAPETSRTMLVTWTPAASGWRGGRRRAVPRDHRAPPGRLPPLAAAPPRGGRDFARAARRRGTPRARGGVPGGGRRVHLGGELARRLRRAERLHAGVPALDGTGAHAVAAATHAGAVAVTRSAPRVPGVTAGATGAGPARRRGRRRRPPPRRRSPRTCRTRPGSPPRSRGGTSATAPPRSRG